LQKNQAGSDLITFRSDEYERLSAKIRLYQPHYPCFNGKRAAEALFGTKAIDYGASARENPSNGSLCRAVNERSGTGILGRKNMAGTRKARSARTAQTVGVIAKRLPFIAVVGIAEGHKAELLV
jgi:hypothetical protein